MAIKLPYDSEAVSSQNFAVAIFSGRSLWPMRFYSSEEQLAEGYRVACQFSMKRGLSTPIPVEKLGCGRWEDSSCFIVEGLIKKCDSF